MSEFEHTIGAGNVEYVSYAVFFVCCRYVQGNLISSASVCLGLRGKETSRGAALTLGT